MSGFQFRKHTNKTSPTLPIRDGVHAAVIVQVASIGLQRPFDQESDPEQQFAIAFELGDGELIAKRMRFSDHPLSGCFDLFTAAFPNLDEADDESPGLSDLLGKHLLIEVEVRDGKWPKVTGIMAMEEGFEKVTPQSQLLEFEPDEMNREVYSKLHRDIRSWVSKRVRH